MASPGAPLDVVASYMVPVCRLFLVDAYFSVVCECICLLGLCCWLSCMVFVGRLFLMDFSFLWFVSVFVCFVRVVLVLLVFLFFCGFVGKDIILGCSLLSCN